MIKAANKAKIRVRALDCTASYHPKGLSAPNARANMFSYFANEVIKADQAAFGPHNWVALMGNAHADMFHGVPGIAQLQDAVSLTVRDVATGHARALHRGEWEILDGGVGTPEGLAVRSDFKVDVAIAGTSAPRNMHLTDRAWLRSVDDFLVERPSSTQATVVHYSNSGAITSSPVQINDKGQFFIEHWPQLQTRRYASLRALTDALKSELSLTAVSANTVPSVRLKNVGDFVVEHVSSTQANLVHRSRSADIVSTPIQRDEAGRLFITRWPQLKDRRYATMGALTNALKTEVGLTAVL